MQIIKTNKKFTGLLPLLLFFIISTLFTTKANAQKGLEVQNDTLTKSVLIHPVIKTKEHESLFTREHTYRKQLRLGDQLARDFVVSNIAEDGRPIIYKNDGKQNSDYFSWERKVFAPFDAKVKRINEPNSTNKPGNMNRNERPGLIFFEKENGLKLIYAHVQNIEVGKGDRVKAGQVVAEVGNNGNSRAPHVHVGAWKNKTPLQIQVDLYADQRE
ncbi:MAG: peptidoglycan DD-metalloendopeptidase family protein [Aliifodinibius sp.]|nr:M23 family metallopeptidase [Fodinibius sp.]NIV15627.1 peptidoglycan DD-metalloendopeptidase family protein [Fodinibius sp.]NIY29474.1 peptidoglycan DD-metalloendopeptidase family protein [Fodinibius sp.]